VCVCVRVCVCVCVSVQSDIIHQSALELIHSEDRETFKSQLDWRSQLNADNADLSVDQLLQPGMYLLYSVMITTITHYHPAAYSQEFVLGCTPEARRLRKGRNS